MKRILVPTDFSDTAENAIDFAVQTSKIFPAKITLLHSYEVYSSFSTDYLGVNREFTYSMLNDIEKNLDEVKNRILKQHGIEVDTFISTYPLYNAIEKAVQEKKPDLIIMGTLGASGIKEKIWGSRTSSVIGKTKIPVLVIPDSYKWSKPKKMLLATNRFQKDPEILRFLFELAGLYMANVQVGVFTDTDNDKAETFIENKQKIAEYEDFLKSTYYENTLTSNHLTGTDFRETIQDYISQNDIDILVMVTYQTGFWKRLFNPSMTKKMSYHTEVPLLAIPGV
ncbi:MAG: universal stress protein [Chitinophagaceae bacterium]|nr:universal stress protein [Chitinophagaceae bacterium]